MFLSDSSAVITIIMGAVAAELEPSNLLRKKLKDMFLVFNSA